MELEGKIRLIGATQNISDRLSKRELVLTTLENYPQHISIEFINDKTSLLDGLNPGDHIKIGINIRGREWTDKSGQLKFFNSIAGWKIERVGATSNSAPAYSAETVGTPPPMPPLSAMEDDDDVLPF